jgi:hypothetical protein
VVINDLDVRGVTILPCETDSPLVVNPDTVLTTPPALEFLQAIARRDAKVLKRFRRVQGHQLSQHDMKQVGWKPPHWLPVKQTLSVAVGETFDHQ